MLGINQNSLACFVQGAIEQQQKLDELRLDFAKKAAVSYDQACNQMNVEFVFLQNFNNWMDNAIDDLQDTFNIHSIAEVEQLQAEHEEFKATALQEASSRYDELNALVQQMADMGSTDNPYTTLTPNVSDKFVRKLVISAHSLFGYLHDIH